MKVRFTADYDHRWPSRAITAFKAGYVGTVRREVGDAAIAKGRATEICERDIGRGDAAAPANSVMGRRRGMAEPDDAHHVGADVRGSVMDGAKQ